MSASPSKLTKGHWPKGKVRNAWGKGDWSSIRERARAMIRDHRLFGERSGTALAIHLGVDPTTMNGWLRGEDHPPESIRDPLLAWLKHQERLINRGRKI